MRRGSVVMLGENLGPTYLVEHIAFGMAWIFPHERAGGAQDHLLVPLSRCREVNSVYPSFFSRRSSTTP